MSGADEGAAGDGIEDLDALLDEITPVVGKKGAAPLKRTKKQKAAAAKAVERKEKEHLVNADKAAAQQLAQIVNLTIAGHSFAAIGAQIGRSADEVEQMIQQGAGQYVRTQPALRTYVRNFLSAKYSEMLDATFEQSLDKSDPKQLEYSAQSLKILKEMGRLHGAEAPTQSEVKVEASPEAVEKLVARLAQSRGVGYDMDVFDIVDAEIVEDAVDESRAALEVSRNAVEDPQPEDGETL